MAFLSRCRGTSSPASAVSVIRFRAAGRAGGQSPRSILQRGALIPGVRAVITQSFERIHRVNLMGLGVLSPFRSRKARMSAASA
ncbi:MAG: hypothetical protein ABSG98_08680 [Anaerolineales bacterium]